MIPRDCLTAWQTLAPWVQDARADQDLGISRALLEMFSHRPWSATPRFVATDSHVDGQS